VFNVSEDRVPETLPKEVLKKMHDPEKRMTRKYPIASPNTLETRDAYLFPTLYGNMPTQFKVLSNHIVIFA